MVERDFIRGLPRGRGAAVTEVEDKEEEQVEVFEVVENLRPERVVRNEVETERGGGGEQVKEEEIVVEGD